MTSLVVVILMVDNNDAMVDLVDVDSNIDDEEKEKTKQ